MDTSSCNFPWGHPSQWTKSTAVTDQNSEREGGKLEVFIQSDMGSNQFRIYFSLTNPITCHIIYQRFMKFAVSNGH